MKETVFYKVLVMKDGSIIHDPFATSHKDLIDKYISPNREITSRDYFRATFSPENEYDLLNIDSYQLKYDTISIPEWYISSVKETALGNLRDIISKMIIRGRRNLLLNECVILGEYTVIEEAKNSIIFGMFGQSKIRTLDVNSEVHLMTDHALIDEMRDGSKVVEMLGFTKINAMYDYSKIRKMFGQARVVRMFNNSRIRTLRGDATINLMMDDSEAERMRHMSRVDEMHNNAIIEEMWDWTEVGAMFDNAQIQYMDDDARVGEMHDNSMIMHMAGSAIVERLYENSLVRKLEEMAKIVEKKIADNS